MLTYPYSLRPGQLLYLPGDFQTPEPDPESKETGQAAQQSKLENVPATYSVQRGEYLAEIARRFEVDWRGLAEINGIGYPYVIYAGQVLRIK